MSMHIPRGPPVSFFRARGAITAVGAQHLHHTDVLRADRWGSTGRRVRACQHLDVFAWMLSATDVRMFMAHR
jgi:hypothetical protein